MSDTSTQTQLMHGGEFLIKESHAANTFIPEDFNDEQLMMADAARQFIETEVQPVVDRLEKLEDGLTVSLLEKSGELGLLGASIPEEYGGFGYDYNTGTLLLEQVGAGSSFAVSLAAHTGIGSLPILYFGTEEQKKKTSIGLKKFYKNNKPHNFKIIDEETIRYKGIIYKINKIFL